MRVKYDKRQMALVDVKGERCEFTDLRIEPESLPPGKFLYEVADDCGNGKPARIRTGIWADFFGSLVCDKELDMDEGGVVWIQEEDWKWVPQVSRTFLVQRMIPDDGTVATVMSEYELIHYIDMADCHGESYEIFDVTEFGKVTQCHYAGWQPNCLIVIHDNDGNEILRGYGVDH